MIEVAPPDAWAEAEAAERQGRITKPTGSLGRLEDLSMWLAGCQGVCPPRVPQRVRVVIFAGDHGIASAGVSAYPPEVTAQMLANFAAGGATITVLARLFGASVRVLDMAVGRPSGRIDLEDALTREEAHEAYDAGCAVADEEADAGVDLLVPGDMGIANTTPCAVLVGALTHTEPVSVTGRGTGVDDAAWMRKVAAVRDALRRCRGKDEDPMALLATAGGADLAALTGFLVQAAVRRTPVVLDGVVSATCALLAETLAPGARRWYVAGSRSPEPAQRLALDALGLQPLLDLGLRLGEGSGGLLAVPLLQAAAAALAETATFEEAGVRDRG